MSEVFVAYDTRSGQILGVHHGPSDANYRWNHKYGAHEHIAVVRTPALHCAHGKRYKIDTHHKTLVESAPDEHGVSFSFGKTASMP